MAKENNSAEKKVRNIRRKTRKKFSAEDKILNSPIPLTKSIFVKKDQKKSTMDFSNKRLIATGQSLANC